MSALDDLIDKIRYSSREMVRELGLLAGQDPDELPPSFRHALVELNLHGALNHIELANLLKLDKSTISRIVKKLIKEKLVSVANNLDDQRVKRILLTPKGKKTVEELNNTSNKQVHDALLQLPEKERESVLLGIELYAKALKRSRIQNAFQIRPIQKKDNLEIMMIIKKVLKEYNADRPGFAFVDPELEDMHKAYSVPKSAYFVVASMRSNKLIGGAGIGPLPGGEASVCELKRMYFLPETRGLGLGYALLAKTLNFAKEQGYKQCYLETLTRLDKANNLYKKFGFTQLSAPLGNTGHFGCDMWYVKKL